MPKQHLTTLTLDTLPAVTKQTTFWDSAVRGFGLRMTPKGRKTWILMYRPPPNRRIPRRLTLGRYPDLSLADARQKADAARGDLAKGVDPATEKDEARRSGTFGELALAYLESAKVEKRSWKEDERIINKDFLPIWRFRQLSELKRRDVRNLIKPLTKRGKGIIANRTLSLLRTMFDFAIDDELIEANPCARVKRPVPEHRRDRVLSEDEIQTLWSELNGNESSYGAILKLQLLTAQRIGEILSLSWPNVDLQSGWMTIPAERSKNGLSHRVPLSNSATVILQALKLQSSNSMGWVFPGPRKSEQFLQFQTLHKTVGRLRRTINFTTHDLRRTAATYIAASGASRQVLKRILNHRDLDVTARYDHHSYDREARQALDAWGRRVQSIVESRETSANVVPFSAGQK